MKSYTTMRNLYGTLTSNQETANLTLGDQVINDGIRTAYNIRKGNWWFLEIIKTVLTTASVEYVTVPNNIRKLVAVRVKVGGITYLPTPVFDDDTWNQIVASRLAESNIPLFYRRLGNKLYFQPVPSSTGSEVIMYGRQATPDLSIADYSTGTIVSITNGAKALVGSGTTWTASMAGRWIRITASDTANKGDGMWYQIASVESATTLTLEAPYEGTTIAAGAAVYTIGQMSLIPEAYDLAPVYRAVAMYWMQKDQKKSVMYWKMYDGGQEAGLLPPGSEPGGLIGQMLENETGAVEGTYMSPLGNEWIDPNNPQQVLATGLNP